MDNKRRLKDGGLLVGRDTQDRSAGPLPRTTAGLVADRMA
jgi:hypothetical protein